MTWQEAVEIVVERTGNERFAYLCSDDNPDEWSRNGYRVEMLRQAMESPTLAGMAANVAGAVFRTTTAAVMGKPIRARQNERDRRWAICSDCPELVEGRCQKCGCFMQPKVWLAQEHCPIGKW